MILFESMKVALMENVMERAKFIKRVISIVNVFAYVLDRYISN